MQTILSFSRRAPRIAVLLTLASLPAAAQEPVSTASPQADENAREEAPQGPNTPPEEEVVIPEAGPLEDYEASEQISEDLSVSFPVDI